MDVAFIEYRYDDNQIYDPNLKEKEHNHLLKDILPNGMQPLLNFCLSENLGVNPK